MPLITMSPYRQSSSSAVTAPTNDQVRYLMHFNGTSTPNQTVVVDEKNHNISASPFSFNTTNKKFGESSFNFLGGSNTLSGALPAVDYPVLDDFTVEVWIYPTALGTTSGNTAWRGVFAFGGNDGTGNMMLAFNSTGTLTLGNRSTFYLTSTEGAVKVNQWQHVAVTRKGSKLTIWVDGKSVGAVASTAVSSWNISPVNDTNIRFGHSYFGVASGTYFVGQYDEFRYVKGLAVYDAEFTPPTEEFSFTLSTPAEPTLAQLQTIMHFDEAAGSKTTVDVDGQAYTLAASSVITSSNKKFGSSSVEFSGGGGHIPLNRGAADVMGTQDFTIEMWIYPTSLNYAYPSAGALIGIGAASRFSMLVQSEGRLGAIATSAGGTAQIYSQSGTIKVNQWHHVAFTRQGTNLSIWIDGVLRGQTTAAVLNQNEVNDYLGTGSVSSSQYGNYIGLIDEVRITRGKALYTNYFTPPSAPFALPTSRYEPTADQLVTLMHFDGTPGPVANGGNYATKGSVVANNCEYVSSPVLFGATSSRMGQSKWWTASITSGKVLTDVNFTLEINLYVPDTASTTTRKAIFGFGGTGTVTHLYVTADRGLALSNGGANVITTAAGLVTNNSWHHIAFTRRSGVFTLWLNGQAVGTSTAWNIPGSSNLLGRAIDSSGVTFYNDGYLDEYRFSHGVAVYRTPFTPPTEPFQLA